MDNVTYIPGRILSKDDIRKITQEITPEQVQYVADIKCIGDQCKEICAAASGEECECGCEKCECGSDEKCCCKEDECKCGFDSEQLAESVVFICKLFAFSDKLRVLHWAAPNMSYHNALDDFLEKFDEYKDAIAENIQGVINCQFSPADFTQINLPVEDNPICVLNEIKQCLDSFLTLHMDDVAYEGCRNATSGMLETVYKYLYIFRICKEG